MPTAEVNVRSEIDLVEDWRAHELKRAGYPAEGVAQLAARHDIDLHYAVELLERGCDPDIALRILL